MAQISLLKVTKNYSIVEFVFATNILLIKITEQFAEIAQGIQVINDDRFIDSPHIFDAQYLVAIFKIKMDGSPSPIYF